MMAVREWFPLNFYFNGFIQEPFEARGGSTGINCNVRRKFIYLKTEIE